MTHEPKHKDVKDLKPNSFKRSMAIARGYTVDDESRLGKIIPDSDVGLGGGLTSDFSEFSELHHAVHNAIDKNLKFCNWIEEQSVSTYFDQLQSEVGELKEAIENKDISHIKEELGDVLWDVLMLTKINERDTGIKLADVMDDVLKKIQRRKPNVFENKKVSIPEAHRIWTEAKEKEKQAKHNL